MADCIISSDSGTVLSATILALYGWSCFPIFVGTNRSILRIGSASALQRGAANASFYGTILSYQHNILRTSL